MTTSTNKSRRAHPAVIRAALRLRRRATYATNGAPFTLASSTADTRKGYAVVVQPMKRQQPRSNALGQKTSHTYPDGASYTYSYDTLDHFTGATYSNSSQTGSTSSPQANESYSYDPLANRITGSNASTGSAQGPTNYSYNANNQLTQAGSVSYTYDANGNTTSQTDAGNATNTRSYVYDTDNRLVEVHDAANAIIATYRYDPFGRRLSKTLSNTASTGSAQAPAGSSTYYFYSAEGLIAEADANGQIIQSYGYAPGSTFSTNPLWTKLSTAGTATYYTYQNDHLGTPQKLLNQSGITVWSATYDAFGRATIDPASTITNNLRFPGQYADQETGLHYNWMRFYDPNTGRYVTSDPIGLEGGVNEYAYVGGNPIGSIDPWGLANGPAIGWMRSHPSPKTSEPLFHYLCKPNVDCSFTPQTKTSLNCFVNCLKRDITITGGRKSRSTPNSSHARGEAIDIGRGCNPDLKNDDVKKCFLQCFKEGYGQEEMNAPAIGGTHFHFQLHTVKGGQPGFSPTVRPYKP